MRKLNKLISICLVLCICLSLTCNAFALDLSNEIAQVAFDEQQEAMRFEDVKVEGILNFSEDAIESVENFVVADEDGLFFVDNDQELSATLTEDEYALVLEQIQIVNNETLLAAAAANGTEGSPYILTAGTAYNTSGTGASSTWFSISGVRGATDFIVNTSRSASVVIYKKNLIGKTQLDTASGSSINKTISASATNNNSNNYLINVQVSASMTSAITVQQHTDRTTTYYSNGTVWTPYNLSAIPDTNVLTTKMWYLKASDVDKLVTFINHDKYLQFCDDFFAGTITAAGIAVTLFGPAGTAAQIAGGKVVGIALSLIGLSTSSMFKQHVLNSIDSAGGWNGASFTKNVFMKQVFSTNAAMYFTYVYTWTGSNIYGEAGYTGSFSAPPTA